MFFKISTFLASGPFMIIACTALIIVEVKEIGIVVPFLLIAGVLSQYFLLSKVSFIRKEILKYMDIRNKLINECITGIRILK